MRHLLLAALLLATPALAEDWPKYMGPKGDGISTEKIADFTDAGPKELWRIPMGKGYASPVVVKDKLYINALTGKDETLYCLDAATGKEIWKSSAGAGWAATGAMGFPGSRATPTIDGDFVYTFSGKGDLVCLKTADGSVVWKTSVIQDTNAKDLTWGSSCSPAVIGDVIYVQGGNGGAMVVAIDKKTGKYLWKSANGVASYATPILIKVDNVEQLIVAAGKEILGLNPADGKTIWSVPWITSYDVNAATPIFQKGQLFVSSGYGHGSILLTVSATGVKTVWEKKNSIQAKFPTPFLEPDDTLIGNSEGTITAIDWSTGNTLWKGKDNLGPGGSLLRLPEGKLLAISERGKLFLYKADRKEITRIATSSAVDGTQVWASPVVSNGRLFLKGGEELAAFDVAPK